MGRQFCPPYLSTEQSGVLKEAGDVREIADVRVGDYGLDVVKVEVVLKMVGVRGQNHQRKPQTEDSAVGKDIIWKPTF